MSSVIINDLDVIAEAAARRAIEVEVNHSPMIGQAIEKAIKNVVASELAPQIEAALSAAVLKLCQDPEFMAELVRATMLHSVNKLGGAFDAAMARAGKNLMLDGEFLSRFKDAVTHEVLTEREAKGHGGFS